MTTPNNPSNLFGDEDDNAPVQLIGIRNGAGVPDTFVNDFFAAEAPSETNQLIPAHWVERSISRDLTSATNLLNDNEAIPTETKMNIDNETTNANEANENEEFPVTEASIKEREDIYGVHTAKKPAKPLWICEPAGISRVISTSASHAREMAKKAVAIAASNAG